MSNGFGAGFFAISLLAVLGVLALLDVLVAAGWYAYQRRTGGRPPLVRYLPAVVLAAVLAVAGFGVLVLYDEAASLAWLVASTALLPLLVVGVYLDRTTALARPDVVAATVLAWGPAFVTGVLVVFGTRSGIDAVLGLTVGESRQLGVAWLAAAVGGLVVVLGMLALSSRLVGLLDAEPEP